MAKEKLSEKDFLSRSERIPSRERMFQRYSDILRALAGFYGFEKMSPSFLEDARYFAALLRAGFFAERMPVSLVSEREGGAYVRFSGALSLVRAYTSCGMNDLPHPLRMCYEGSSFFRCPEQGEEITVKDEWGLLMIGEEAPVAEAEIVLILWRALRDMQIEEDMVELSLNATGCNQCRTQFRSAFLSYLRSRAGRLCKTCKQYIKTASTKVLLCREEKCMSALHHAPQILDYLCDACKKHLKRFLEFLDEVEIPYSLDSKLFREGSWFNLLLFEFAARNSGKTSEEANASTPDMPSAPDARLVLAEGGRLSRAGELVIGRALDAASGVIFLDAIEEYALRMGVTLPDLDSPKVFLAQLGEFAKRKSLRMLELLRIHGIETKESLGRDSIKSQLKVAEIMGVEIALILGQKEALDETVIIREMESGIQEIIPQERMVEFLKRRLKK